MVKQKDQVLDSTSSLMWMLLSAVLLLTTIFFATLWVTEAREKQNLIEDPVLDDTNSDNGSSDDSSGDTKKSAGTYTLDGFVLYLNYNQDKQRYEYNGSVELPTPCYSLESDSIIAESYPEQVTLYFSKTEKDKDGVCAQVITNKSFSGNVSVSEGATFTVQYDGKVVPKVSDAEVTQ